MRVVVLARTCRVLGGCSNVLGGSSRVLVMMMLVNVIVCVLVDDELGRRDAGAEHPLRVDVRVAEREAAERSLQLVERQTGVDERAERHVAGNAREAVEVERFHNRRDSLKLQ